MRDIVVGIVAPAAIASLVTGAHPIECVFVSVCAFAIFGTLVVLLTTTKGQ
jgi:hypothetical protein